MSELRHDLARNADGVENRLSRQMDVALLDIVLPMRDGEAPLARGGLRVLEYVLIGSQVNRPSYVIGMTADPGALGSGVAALSAGVICGFGAATSGQFVDSSAAEFCQVPRLP